MFPSAEDPSSSESGSLVKPPTRPTQATSSAPTKIWPPPASVASVITSRMTGRSTRGLWVAASASPTSASASRGSLCVAFGGRRIYFWPRIATSIQESGGKEILLTVARDGVEKELHISPALTELRGEKIWRIGVSFRSNMVVRQLEDRIRELALSFVDGPVWQGFSS